MRRNPFEIWMFSVVSWILCSWLPCLTDWQVHCSRYMVQLLCVISVIILSAYSTDSVVAYYMTNAMLVFVLSYIICCGFLCKGTDISVAVTPIGIAGGTYMSRMSSPCWGGTSRGPQNPKFWAFKKADISKTVSRSITCELNLTSARQELSKNLSYGAGQ